MDENPHMESHMKYAGLVAVMISGCTSEAPETSAPGLPQLELADSGDDLEAYRVAHVVVGPGHEVSFYAPEPGMVGMIELRDAAIAESALDPELDAGRTYAALRPNEPMPPALRTALQQAAAIPVSTPAIVDEAAMGGGRRVTARAAVDAASYVNNSGACDIAFVSNRPVLWSICRIDWGGGFFASDGGAQAIHGQIGVVQGTVTGRVQVGGSIFDRTIGAGTIAVYSFGNNAAGTRRIDVFNAEGDWFHASAKFRVCTASSCASNTWN
jgi:hypothetical protein